MRITIIIILGFTIGLILISNIGTVSLFGGSHYVVNVSGNGNDINCTSCHRHVAEELYSNPNAPHYDLSCENCHRFKGSGIQFAVANSSGAFPGKQAHAAYVPKCLDCHGGNGVWLIDRFGQVVHAPPARAFNVTPIPYYAAHKQMVEYCRKLGDENLACLACHANYSINMTFEYHWNIVFSSSGWNPSVTINGTKVYNVSVIKLRSFSGKHAFLPIRPVCMINCSKCHPNIYLGLINGKHAPIYYDSWPAQNFWGHPRFHGLASTTLNVSWINNSYCYECHNYTKWNASAEYPGKGQFHCAEKVSCLTCHGYGQFKDPYPVISNPAITLSRGGDAAGHENLLNQTASYPRFVHGDICMACHTAALHGGGQCNQCHYFGNAYATIYSEP